MRRKISGKELRRHSIVFRRGKISLAVEFTIVPIFFVIAQSEGSEFMIWELRQDVKSFFKMLLWKFIDSA